MPQDGPYATASTQLGIIPSLLFSYSFKNAANDVELDVYF